MIVPPEGFHIWEGKTSSQVNNNPKKFPNTEGQYMPGGGTQLFIDLEFEATKIGLTRTEFVKRLEITVEETPWTDAALYNSEEFHVPRKVTEANFLEPFEIESKNRLPATLIEKADRRKRHKDE